MYVNTEKITQEFCRGRTLVFRPASVEEARKIQARLFALGFGWRRGGKKILMEKDCVEGGLTLSDDGCIYFGVNDEAQQKGFLCTLAQFNKPLAGDDLLKAYNLLSKEVTGLRNRVKELESALKKKSDDKLKPGVH